MLRFEPDATRAFARRQSTDRVRASCSAYARRTSTSRLAEGLYPYLRQAVVASPSELVFPKEDDAGSPMRADVKLEKVLRRAMARAGHRPRLRARVPAQGVRAQRAGRGLDDPALPQRRREALAQAARPADHVPPHAPHDREPDDDGGRGPWRRAARPAPQRRAHDDGLLRAPGAELSPRRDEPAPVPERGDRRARRRERSGRSR